MTSIEFITVVVIGLNVLWLLFLTDRLRDRLAALERQVADLQRHAAAQEWTLVVEAPHPADDGQVTP